MFSEFEKNLGLQVKPLNTYEDENDEALHNPDQDHKIFEHVFKNTYSDIQSKHRKVLNSLRTTEFGTFQKLNNTKQEVFTAGEETPYDKIQSEVEKIKAKMNQVNKAKSLMGRFEEEVANKSLGFRDFYELNRSDSEEEQAFFSGADSDCKSSDSFDYPGKKKKHG